MGQRPGGEEPLMQTKGDGMLDTADETLALIRELLESQWLAVLSTQDHGQPYCNIIAIAATDDLKNLLFATTRATRKYANLMADPRVAVLVDNRKNDPSDFADAAAVLKSLPGQTPIFRRIRGGAHLRPAADQGGQVHCGEPLPGRPGDPDAGVKPAFPPRGGLAWARRRPQAAEAGLTTAGIGL
jgi:hypothetical protein